MQLFIVMVLGQKKLGKIATPDPWKSRAANATGKILIVDYLGEFL